MNDAVKLLPYPVTPEVWQLACEYYARGQGNEQTRIIGEFIMLVQYLRNNQDVLKPMTIADAMREGDAKRAPTPREQELEAQNKALWELVGRCQTVLARIATGVPETETDKYILLQVKGVLATIENAKEQR